MSVNEDKSGLVFFHNVRKRKCAGGVRRRRTKIDVTSEYLYCQNIENPVNLPCLREHSTSQDSELSLSRPNLCKHVGISRMIDISDPPSESPCVLTCSESCTLPCSQGSSSQHSSLSYYSLMPGTYSNDCDKVDIHDIEPLDGHEWTCRNTSDEPIPSDMSAVINSSSNAMPPLVDETKNLYELSGEHVNDTSNCTTKHDRIVFPAVCQSQGKSEVCEKQKKIIANAKNEKNMKDYRKKFPCGNYVAYYGYRNTGHVEDARLQLLQKELFNDKDILDIGCNAGSLTIAVASRFTPRKILGIDVDAHLISLAKRNVRHFIEDNKVSVNLTSKNGPAASGTLSTKNCTVFPHNILFQIGDYVPCTDLDVLHQSAEFDVILAMSVTKWFHLTYGDEGLKRAFRRMYLQLRPGGKLVLEAQPWSSYRRKKKVTEKVFQMYQSISFKPDQFNDYLLSLDVGFASCELLGTPTHQSKGFQRSIYVFTKACAAE